VALSSRPRRRGCVQVDVGLSDDSCARGAVPSGASTGTCACLLSIRPVIFECFCVALFLSHCLACLIWACRGISAVRLVHAVWLTPSGTCILCVCWLWILTVTHVMLKFLGLDVCVVDFFARFD
jgi:hypothetical protein